MQPNTTAEYYGGISGFSRTASARTALDVAVDSEGRVLVVGAGRRFGGNGTIDAWVARLTAGGQLDPSFGNGGIATVDLNNGWADYGMRIIVDGFNRIAFLAKN